MSYRKVEQQIIPARHIVTVSAGYSGLAVKEAMSNVPDNASLEVIQVGPDGNTILEFKEGN